MEERRSNAIALYDIMAYYDGVKLLSLKDLDGREPEIYIVTTNRTGGKTTYFGRLCVNKFLDNGGKFALLYRYNYELDDCADKFFKDLSTLFFNGSTMTSVRKAGGVYHELLLDGKSCGYALSLNNADIIKKYSHLFSDVNRILFDEFQPESNRYCANELKKFQSIHTSIARGQGKQVRYVPVYMLANAVTIINPYYVALGISSRLKSDTKFLRGHGFVLEQGYVDSAREAQKQSGFNRAFADDSYQNYASENVYLNDNNAFIGVPKGKCRYICTIKVDGVDYAIREYMEQGVIYCDTRPDLNFPIKIAVTTDDHEINYVMLKHNDTLIQSMRYFFERGCWRFKDLKCKEAVLKTLSF